MCGDLGMFIDSIASFLSFARNVAAVYNSVTVPPLPLVSSCQYAGKLFGFSAGAFPSKLKRIPFTVFTAYLH